MTASEVRRIREALKLNMSQFAERVHVSEATVSLWESGKRRPDKRSQVLVRAAALGIELAQTA